MVHRVTTSGTTTDNEWQRVIQWVTTSGTTSDSEWQQMTKSGITSDNEWQRVTASGTTSDKEWQRVVQRVATSDNKWQWVTESDRIGTRNENGTVHFKEWMIAILSMTKTDTLLFQGMDDCN